MKKLNIAIALALGLLLPSVAMAASDTDVTIRLMQMHEKSTQEVMNRLELPEMAIDKVTEEANYKKRLIKRVSDTEAQAEQYSGEGPGDSNGSGEEAAQGTGVMQQNQFGNTEHEFDNEPAMEQAMEMEQEQSEIANEHEEPQQGNEPPEDHQPGPGLGG